MQKVGIIVKVKKKNAHLQDGWNYCPSIMQMKFVAQDKIFRVINIPETT